ncbi:DUF2933 domain-containing protein [Candidatus Kaiserbacteria bacterium]|nr:DUF2933 domain-containing protein [Candidatus Kaiserbacteria bacterium]
MNYQTIRWVLIGLLVIIGAYIAFDHGQHLVPYLPLAFLLGCLFMHLFGHGGHGGHGGHDQPSDGR